MSYLGCLCVTVYNVNNVNGHDLFVIMWMITWLFDDQPLDDPIVQLRV